MKIRLLAVWVGLTVCIPACLCAKILSPAELLGRAQELEQWEEQGIAIGLSGDLGDWVAAMPSEEAEDWANRGYALFQRGKITRAAFLRGIDLLGKTNLEMAENGKLDKGLARWAAERTYSELWEKIGGETLDANEWDYLFEHADTSDVPVLHRSVWPQTTVHGSMKSEAFIAWVSDVKSRPLTPKRLIQLKLYSLVDPKWKYAEKLLQLPNSTAKLSIVEALPTQEKELLRRLLTEKYRTEADLVAKAGEVPLKELLDDVQKLVKVQGLLIRAVEAWKDKKTSQDSQIMGAILVELINQTSLDAAKLSTFKMITGGEGVTVESIAKRAFITEMELLRYYLQPLQLWLLHTYREDGATPVVDFVLGSETLPRLTAKEWSPILNYIDEVGTTEQLVALCDRVRMSLPDPLIEEWTQYLVTKNFLGQGDFAKAQDTIEDLELNMTLTGANRSRWDDLKLKVMYLNGEWDSTYDIAWRVYTRKQDGESLNVLIQASQTLGLDYNAEYLTRLKKL
jgi:hypothetical protein